MEAVIFLVFWIGSALLHTFYDLKIKPRFRADRQGSGSAPFSR
ncbi:hypothetical protein [Desulforhopalus singaporensis]|uniref:Uncharacterized protein n=1 Tax=Desulforhopalus singaporensis TaxID=91360 RepID=A0A1H0N5A1_9BACT|nr:hypothetical protein [Desulforhopalus singaporensis]SDO87675.1 hypothetical protein SAMN05660330_01247 [Desulforhopalus singaporensis]